jgi:hypothetical protein
VFLSVCGKMSLFLSVYDKNVSVRLCVSLCVSVCAFLSVFVLSVSVCVCGVCVSVR